MPTLQAKLRRSTRTFNLPSPSVERCELAASTPIKRRTATPSQLASSKPSTPNMKKPSPKFRTPDWVQQKNSMINDLSTSETLRVDPMIARLQRDLNSPSAGSYLRAKKALKSQIFQKQVYGQFDVPHERLDLVTEEERKPLKPKTIEEIFKDCKVYVEVRSGDDNRSAGIKCCLLRDGINVNEKLYKDTTHVIFKEGLLSTYNKAIKLGIPVTTVLWINACKSQKRLVDPSRFKISNLERYEHPELYPRLRRQKSMQPEIRQLSTTLSKEFMAQDKQQRKDDTILEEQNEDLRLESQNEESLENTLCQTPQTRLQLMDAKENKIMTHTPNVMEQIAAKQILDRRRTLFTPQTMQQTVEEASESSIYNAFKNNSIVFNSANRIAKNSRRSIYDISMNIFDLNCKIINQQCKAQLPQTTAEKVESITTRILEVPQSSEKNLDTQVAAKPQELRKRKLFIDEHEVVDNFKENHNKEITNSYKKPKLDDAPLVESYKTLHSQKKTKIERRNTLQYFKTKKPKLGAVSKEIISTKPAESLKAIVCTNMSHSDKKIIHAAIVKLGGKVEAEVTTRTTHVVTPNENRTMNVLRGIVRACSIVNVKWVHESLAAGNWLKTSAYLHNICDSNKVYERKVITTKNYKNLIFSNISFFINKEAIDDSAKKVEYLTELITLCNGIITKKKSEAKVIVSDQPFRSNDPKQAVVTSTYIFDSAEKSTCLDTSQYKPKLMP